MISDQAHFRKVCLLSTSCRRSSSAACFCGIGILLLSQVEANAVFGARWVNTNSRVQLSLCHTTLEADGDSLCDLTCIRASNMETDDLVICLIDEYLGVCGTDNTLRSVLPFKRSEPSMVCCDLFSAKSLLCLIFSQTNCAVFEWCEDGCRHGIVVH